MDNDFPRMLYRFPAVKPDAAKLQDGAYDTLIVGDEKEAKAALADGFFMTSPEARAAGETVDADGDTSDDAQPTRAELEAKATELGIRFDGRTGDKKLRDQIAAALE